MDSKHRSRLAICVSVNDAGLIRERGGKRKFPFTRVILDPSVKADFLNLSSSDEAIEFVEEDNT